MILPFEEIELIEGGIDRSTRKGRLDLDPTAHANYTVNTTKKLLLCQQWSPSEQTGPVRMLPTGPVSLPEPLDDQGSLISTRESMKMDAVAVPVSVSSTAAYKTISSPNFRIALLSISTRKAAQVGLA